MPDDIVFHITVNATEAIGMLNDLTALYAEVYAEPPYHWGEEHADLFRQRFTTQCRAPGFRLVTAQSDTTLVGYAFGVTLQPSTPWWHNLTTDVAPGLTDEWPDRTFALVELLVRQPWRRRGIATRLHDNALAHGAEQRATLTVHPHADAARHAYHQWGWTHAADKRNPLPGDPTFEVMVKDLTPRGRWPNCG